VAKKKNNHNHTYYPKTLHLTLHYNKAIIIECLYKIIFIFKNGFNSSIVFSLHKLKIRKKEEAPSLLAQNPFSYMYVKYLIDTRRKPFKYLHHYSIILSNNIVLNIHINYLYYCYHYYIILQKYDKQLKLIT